MELKKTNENNENSDIIKLFISNIFEQEGGKKGGKKGKKGKKAKKKNNKKKNEGGEGDEGAASGSQPEPHEREYEPREREYESREREYESRERPEPRERDNYRRSESSGDFGSSPSPSYPQIIATSAPSGNLEVDLNNQRENNARQDSELSQLRDLIFKEQNEEIKFLKQKEEEQRREEMTKILNEISSLKKAVEENQSKLTSNPVNAPVVPTTQTDSVQTTGTPKDSSPVPNVVAPTTSSKPIIDFKDVIKGKIESKDPALKEILEGTKKKYLIKYN